jgi:hypothetical protein
LEVPPTISIAEYKNKTKNGKHILSVISADWDSYPSAYLLQDTNPEGNVSLE